MGSFSNYLENVILDEILSAQDYTPPATLYVGVSGTTITDATTGSTVVEPSGGSYARTSLTANLTNFPAASGGSKSNGVEIAMPQATADWIAGADITDWFIADALTNGNILMYGTLNTPTPVLNGDTLKFPIGNMTATLD